MSDSTIGAIIARHIDELEAAMRHAHDTLQPRLGKAAAQVIETRRQALGWAGNVDQDLEEQTWLASESWRGTADGEGDKAFDLYFDFDYSECIDGREPETWLGIFCGFAGAGLRFTFGTHALGVRAWKALLRNEREIVEALVGEGLRCDPKDGDLAVLVSLDRAALADGFEDGDLDAALAPIGAAIDRIVRAAPTLDRLVAAIRAAA